MTRIILGIILLLALPAKADKRYWQLITYGSDAQVECEINSERRTVSHCKFVHNGSLDGVMTAIYRKLNHDPI